ncbi:hypothetical protein MJ584_00425 [Klebsiella pneumoniae]|nr:hypothetical protein MJ584_00425 [Klebsiella pneumoniae]
MKINRYLFQLSAVGRPRDVSDPSGTLAPTVVPLTNGGQANIAVRNN